MKKICLALAAVSMTLAASAQQPGEQGWQKSITAVENAADINRNAPMAVDIDGNVVVTGSYTTDIAFGDNFIEPLATSAYIAKYSAEGAEQWAVGLKGAATITAVTTDESGNVYAAGVFADEVEVGSAGDDLQNITGMADNTNQVSAFVVKYDKNGNLLKVKTIIPSKAADMGSDALYNPEAPDLYYKPTKIAVAGGKVYLMAQYTGATKIDNITLEGRYVNVFDIMHTDVPVLGLVSLSADNLDGAAKVAELATTEKLTNFQTGAESANFAVDGQKLYVAFVATGNDLTLTTANGSKKIADISYDGDTGKAEHAFLLVTVDGANTTTSLFHSTPNDTEAKFNTVDAMTVDDGNLYLAGTFNEALAFNNKLNYTGACDMYVASLKASDMSVNYAVASGHDEGDAKKFNETLSGIVVMNDGVLVYGYGEDMSSKAVSEPLFFSADATGFSKADGSLVTSVADNGKNAVTATVKDKAYTYTYYDLGSSTGIDGTEVRNSSITRTGDTFSFAAAADAAVYDLQGRQLLSAKGVKSVSVASLPAGIYVIKAGKDKMKFAK